LNPVALRPATNDDAARLSELVRAAYGHYVERIGATPRPMTDDYAQVVRTQRVTVAEVDGEVAGLIVLEAAEEAIVIDNVAVDRDRQGAGIGRALLEHAESVARSAGVETVRLYTHPLMTENLALYSRIGYVIDETGEREPRGLVHMYKRLGA
jgi:ribosomal protein S18 acetylase RimI-like enzyme